MRKRRLALWMFGVIVLLVRPGSAFEEKARVRVVLEEELSIGGLDEDVLCMWAGIAVDESGRIFVSDMMEHTLKAFDSSGRLLKTVGRRGQGPGEFNHPLALTRSGDHIYVLEQNRRGIQVFDRDLKFIRLIPCDRALLRIEAAPDRLLVGFPITPSGEGRLVYLNDRGRIVRTLRFSDEEAGLLMDQVSYAVDSCGGLVLAHNYRDRIERFSARGERIWSHFLKKGAKSRTRTIQGMQVPGDLYSRCVAVDSDDRIFILSGDLSPNPARDVFVLSSSGERIATFTLPDSTHLIHIDNRDFLYSRADSGVTLKKYRMRMVKAEGK